MRDRMFRGIFRKVVFVSALALLQAIPQAEVNAKSSAAGLPSVAVGAQYDTTHVYIAAADFDAFVNSFTATFGGKPSPRGTANVLPVPSSTELQYVWTPAGTLSTFAFSTPIPYPYGEERTGYLVTDIDKAMAAARAAGAEVIVDKFRDPIGLDAVIQWPGGVKMQLYWHDTAPSYASLDTIPDNRVYVSRDTVNLFVRDFLRFAHGKVVLDDAHAPGIEIGNPNITYRSISIESRFGKMNVLVTDGHLPYPFGREMTGYEVADLPNTLDKAKASGAKVLVAPFTSRGRQAAFVQFPGGYIAEIHASNGR